MFINPCNANVNGIQLSGTPIIYSITPFQILPYTDHMDLSQRVVNMIWYIMFDVCHYLAMIRVQWFLQEKFGPDIPHTFDMAKNVSFILENGHRSFTHVKPLFSNVADIGCIQCKPPQPINQVCDH